MVVRRNVKHLCLSRREDSKGLSAPVLKGCLLFRGVCQDHCGSITVQICCDADRFSVLGVWGFPDTEGPKYCNP